jgi:hypothetical protein
MNIPKTEYSSCSIFIFIFIFIFNIGAKIAESLNISIIDSFAMTHSLIMEPDIFPDSVHLYSKHLVGNFVSKTISKMFLLQACTQ